MKNTGYVIDGALLGDDVSVDIGALSATFDDDSVGDDKNVTISAIALRGSDKDNYNLISSTATATASIKDELTAANVADKITSIHLLPRDATRIIMPVVPDGFSISIKSSDTPAIITLDGRVSPVDFDTDVALIFTVAKMGNDTSADTIDITVTVLASTKYTITANAGTGGSVTVAGSNVYYKNADVLLIATANTNYIFEGWYENDSKLAGVGAMYSFAAMSDRVLDARFTYTPPVGGGGGGGGLLLEPQTIPSANGAVLVEYTQSAGAVTLSLPDSKINEIISKSDSTVFFDLSKVPSATSATMLKAAYAAFGNATLAIEFKLPGSTVKLSDEAVVSIASQAQGNSISMESKQVNAEDLNAAQKAATKSGNIIYDISINSGTRKINAFDGALDATIPYSGALPVGVWHLSDAGDITKLDSTYQATAKAVVFTITHLSLYMLGQDEAGGSAWLNPFSDVRTDDWFYDAVKYAHQNGLVAGTSATTFSPQVTVTRGMMVTILWNHAGKPMTGSAVFTDVPDGLWYSDAVNWAAANGIVSGISSSLYAPVDEITREQMAVMLHNYAKFLNAELENNRTGTFNDDAQISSWAKEAVSSMYAAEILNGKGNNNFDPQGKATRAEVVAMIRNFLSN